MRVYTEEEIKAVVRSQHTEEELAQDAEMCDKVDAMTPEELYASMEGAYDHLEAQSESGSGPGGPPDYDSRDDCAPGVMGWRHGR